MVTRGHVGAGIALLYLDIDNYEGTLAGKTSIRWSLLAASSHSTVRIGELRESDAVDEFLRDQKIRLRNGMAVPD